MNPPTAIRAPIRAPIHKILLLGDSSVGKTSLMLRFSEDNFHTDILSTIGIDFKVKTVNVDGQLVKLQIWDTAGQEKFRSITKAYYKGAQSIILVYDITNEKSFKNITTWIGDLDKNNVDCDSIVMSLVGNKSDLAGTKRAISTEDGQKLADKYCIPFTETSAKTGENIEEVFMDAVRRYQDKYQKIGTNTNNKIDRKKTVTLKSDVLTKETKTKVRSNSTCCTIM